MTTDTTTTMTTDTTTAAIVHNARTSEVIEQLRQEAGVAGDSEAVAICDRAFAGDRAARLEVFDMIAEARAQGGEAIYRPVVVAGVEALLDLTEAGAELAEALGLDVDVDAYGCGYVR